MYFVADDRCMKVKLHSCHLAESQNRSYSRTAKETQYGVSKIQTNEYMNPGVIEDISIAVTMDKAALPPDLTIDDLKELVAHSASPKARPENVSIVFNDSNDPYLASDNPEKLPKPDETGNPGRLSGTENAVRARHLLPPAAIRRFTRTTCTNPGTHPLRT